MKNKIIDLMAKGTYIFCDEKNMMTGGNIVNALTEYVLITKSLEEQKGSNSKIIKEVQKMASKMTLEEILENFGEISEKIFNLLEEERKCK